jgi:hypothetical protein
MAWRLSVAIALAAAGCTRDAARAPRGPELPAEPVVVDAISAADPVVAAAGAARPAVSTDEAVVVARLVEREGPLPHCGIMWFVEAIEYEIVRVEQGEVAARAITVATSCPEMPPGGHVDELAPGTTYRLRLSQNYPAGLRSPSIERADYWCDSVEPI